MTEVWGDKHFSSHIYATGMEFVDGSQLLSGQGTLPVTWTKEKIDTITQVAQATPKILAHGIGEDGMHRADIEFTLPSGVHCRCTVSAATKEEIDAGIAAVPDYFIKQGWDKP
jgi:hypothetical protein